MARDVQQSDYSGDFNSVSCYDENIDGSKYLIDYWSVLHKFR